MSLHVTAPRCLGLMSFTCVMAALMRSRGHDATLEIAPEELHRKPSPAADARCGYWSMYVPCHSAARCAHSSFHRAASGECGAARYGRRLIGQHHLEAMGAA